jgi:hypothetical protein
MEKTSWTCYYNLRKDFAEKNNITQQRIFSSREPLRTEEKQLEKTGSANPSGKQRADRLPEYQSEKSMQPAMRTRCSMQYRFPASTGANGCRKQDAFRQKNAF